MVSEQHYPRYVRVKNLDGKYEWLVRGVSVNNHSVLSEEQLNRYYRHCGHLPCERSAVTRSERGYLTLAEIPYEEDTIEYDNAVMLRHADLSADERRALLLSRGVKLV